MPNAVVQYTNSHSATVVREGWVMEGSIQSHLSRVQERLSRGRRILELLKIVEPKLYDTPGSYLNQEIRDRDLPLKNDS